MSYRNILTRILPILFLIFIPLGPLTPAKTLPAAAADRHTITARCGVKSWAWTRREENNSKYAIAIEFDKEPIKQPVELILNNGERRTEIQPLMRTDYTWVQSFLNTSGPVQVWDRGGNQYRIDVHTTIAHLNDSVYQYVFGNQLLFYTMCQYDGPEIPAPQQPLPSTQQIFSGGSVPHVGSEGWVCFDTTYKIHTKGTVFLSGTAGGQGAFAIDDILSLTINGSEHVVHSFTKEKEPTALAQFQDGDNIVRVQVISLRDPECGGSQLWLTWAGSLTPPSAQYYDILQNLSFAGPEVGDVYRTSFAVASWMAVNYVILREGSDAQMSFIAPDGTVYDASHPNVDYVDAGAYDFVTLRDLPPGEWEAVLNVTEAESDSVFFLSIGGAQGEVSGADNLGPFSTIQLEGTEGKNDWFISDVTVTLTAEDIGGSGVKAIEYSLDGGSTWQPYTTPFTISHEGLTHLQARAHDNANNTEILPPTKFIYLDKTLPELTIYTDHATYTRTNPPFVIHCSALDRISGLARLDCSFNDQVVEEGQVVDLFWLDLGGWSVTGEAEDYAGLIANGNASFELIATIESLIETNQRLCEENHISNKGICQSIEQKLKAALRARDRQQLNAAINILTALQHEVHAQTNKHISPAAAHLLLMDSSYVLQKLSAQQQ